MKNYYCVIDKKNLTPKYCRRNLIDLTNYFVGGKRYNLNGFRILEIKLIGKVESVDSLCENKNYKIVKEYFLKDFMELYKKTKNKHLLKIILNFDDITEENILSILQILKEKTKITNIYFELDEIMKFSGLTEKSLEAIIDLLKEESYIFFDIAANPKTSEKLLEKIIETVVNSKFLSLNIILSILEQASENPNIAVNQNSAIISVLFKNLIDEHYIENSNLYEFIVDSKSTFHRILANIAKNTKTSNEILKQIFERSHDKEIIKQIAKNPNASSETLKSLLGEKLLFDPSLKSILISIINHPNVNENILTIIAEKSCDHFVLKSIVQSPKVTSYLIYYIINNSIILPKELVCAIIESPEFDEGVLEALLKKGTNYEIKSFSKCKISVKEILDKLHEKFEETGDLKLLEEILFLEKMMVMANCKDNTCDNKLDFRKEYLKILNKYLRTDFLEVRFKVIEEMVKEGYLKRQYIIDKNYIKECHKSPKLCHFLSKIKEVK